MPFTLPIHEPTRPLVFWITMLAAVLAAVVLLREILLPFLAGMVLAYLLDPLATRLERVGNESPRRNACDHGIFPWRRDRFGYPGRPGSRR